MAEGAGSGEQFVPARYQPPLPRERLILPHDAPGAGDRTELDALIVGAGPAGLACGIELARLAPAGGVDRPEEHTAELQSPSDPACRRLLEENTHTALRRFVCFFF